MPFPWRCLYFICPCNVAFQWVQSLSHRFIPIWLVKWLGMHDQIFPLSCLGRRHEKDRFQKKYCSRFEGAWETEIRQSSPYKRVDLFALCTLSAQTQHLCADALGSESGYRANCTPFWLISCLDDSNWPIFHLRPQKTNAFFSRVVFSSWIVGI